MLTLPYDEALVDPHIHQWDPFTTPRVISARARLLRPLPRIPRLLQRLSPRAEREFVGDPTFVLKPYLPADYTADRDGLGVSSVVHVQAGWEGHRHLDSVDETRWVAGLPFGVDRAPDLGAIVVHADPREADVGAVLDAHLAADPRVRGVRCIAAHHPDPGVLRWIREPHLLTAPAFLHGFAALAERAMTFDAWVYGPQLPDVVTLATEYPETTIVLDHYGTPVGVWGPRGTRTGHTSADRASILARWRDDLAAVASCPNVVAKHSGLGMPLLGLAPDARATSHDHQRLVDVAGPLVTHAHDLFGPERSMWASNHPIDKPGASLPATALVLAEVLGDDLHADAMYAGTARRVYGLD